MTRWVLSAFSCLLALWALGGCWTLRQTEARLNEAAENALADARFNGLKVSFRGPVAYLSGVADSKVVLSEAERVLSEEIRVVGGNPVMSVVSQARISEPTGEAATTPEDVRDEPWRSGPQSWVLFCTGDGQAKLSGVVTDQTEKNALEREARKEWPEYKVTNSLQVDATLRPLALLKETLRSLPRPTSDVKESLSVTVGDGVWMRLPVRGDELTVAQALYGTEAKITQVVQSLEEWRQLRATLGLASDGSAVATNDLAPPRAVPLIVRARPVGPAYVGWAALEDEVWLFGAVASEQEKAKVLEQAQKLFGKKIVHVQGVETDPSRLLEGRRGLALPTASTGIPFGVQVAGRTMARYPLDVTDGKLAADFRALGMNEAAVSEALIPFREKLAAKGKLKLVDPSLSVVSDGRVVLLSGEVASVSMKEALLEAMRGLSGGMPLVHDDLRVSPLVSPASEMLLALQQSRAFIPKRKQVFSLRPQQVTRHGVVYSFATAGGEDKMLDVSRALRAMGRVMDVDGTALFEIVGHTDGVGEVQKDAAESLNLAEDVKALLVTAGFDELRLAVRGAGTSEPISENVTQKGRALNRRVDIRWLLIEPQNEEAR